MVLKINPNDHEGYSKRGNLKRSVGNLEPAIADYDAALALNPSYYDGYINRGNAYRSLGIYEQALSNYDTAILLSPNNPLGYNNRGIAYEGKGFYDLSVADYDQAIELRPSYAPAYYNRGNAQFYLGNHQLAALDYEILLRANQSDAYRAIWLYLARERSGEKGMVELETTAAKIDTARWPAPIFKLLLGQTDPQSLLKTLETFTGDQLRQKACEVFFYLGQYYLIEGNPEAAVTYFRRALGTGVTSYIEYNGAKAELTRMGLL